LSPTRSCAMPGADADPPRRRRSPRGGLSGAARRHKKRKRALAKAECVAAAPRQGAPAEGDSGAKAPAAALLCTAGDTVSALATRQSTRLLAEVVSEETNDDTEWTSEEEVEGGFMPLPLAASSVSGPHSPALAAPSPMLPIPGPTAPSLASPGHGPTAPTLASQRSAPTAPCPTCPSTAPTAPSPASPSPGPTAPSPAALSPGPTPLSSTTPPPVPQGPTLQGVLHKIVTQAAALKADLCRDGRGYHILRAAVSDTLAVAVDNDRAAIHGDDFSVMINHAKVETFERHGKSIPTNVGPTV